MDLFGKVILVTGASSGIGAALARQAAGAGARMVLAARREAALEAVAADCPGSSLVVPTDISDAGQRARLVNKTMETHGRIDILVNNAGIGAYGTFLETDEDLWRRLFEIDLFAQVFLTRLVLPRMLDQHAGLIVNMGSIGSLLAHSHSVSPYVSVKHALLGFSRALAKDVAGTGVRVQTACPHLTDTDFFKASSGADKMAPVLSKYRKAMDDPETVARGILDQLGTDSPIIFPGPKTEAMFLRHRDI
jgi:short-subunit dehydrogenase